MALTDEDVFGYVQSAIPSVWALEALRVLHQRRDRAWRAADLVSELRSSAAAIEPAIAALEAAGLIAAENDTYRFRPASETVSEFADRALALYAVRPAWVIRAIMTAPTDKLRIFANAFRLKD
jgi:hypothetical protein